MRDNRQFAYMDTPDWGADGPPVQMAKAQREAEEANTDRSAWGNTVVCRRANQLRAETGMPLSYAMEQADEEVLGIKRTRFWRPPTGRK